MTLPGTGDNDEEGGITPSSSALAEPSHSTSTARPARKVPRLSINDDEDDLQLVPSASTSRKGKHGPRRLLPSSLGRPTLNHPS
ncbi:hypothetical protein JCM1841_004556 [Sporobolomyces salmonicolor]